jgi:hypothetical protein
MAQHGLEMTPQALWDQLYVVAERLKITVAGLIAHVMKHPVIGLDQTGWPTQRVCDARTMRPPLLASGFAGRPR